MSNAWTLTGQDRHARTIEKYEAHAMRLGYAPGTVEQRVARLRALPVPPEDATTADVLASLPGDVKPSTKRVYLGALRAAYRDLITLGLVERDPTIGIRIPGVGRKIPRPLTDDQVETLLAERGRERDWTALGCYAGLRASDVVSLYAEDLVRTSSGMAIRLTGKGNVESMIPAHDVVVDVIRRQASRGPLWRMQAASMSHRWSSWAYDLGVSGRFHQCRHWFATNVYRQSGDLLVTRDLMRHTSVATTQIYTAVDPEKHYLAVAGL